MPTILIINGPNLNLLGQREPEIYGTDTLDDVIERCTGIANKNQVNIEAFQSNHEGQLIDRIHQAGQQPVDWIIINPAAFTHTSVALRDALAGVAIPFIELHISNVHSRESFRHHSYLSDIAQGVICGLGIKGYELATQAVIDQLEK
jgi:3-dehydroquinate dehydratase-2